MMRDIMLAGTGGFAGSILRYLISVALASTVVQTGFPIGTLLVNALGSLLIGILWAALPAGGWHTLAVAGFCGGFTTFSTFSLETVRMLKNGETGSALLYTAASVFICLIFVWAGFAVTEKIMK